MGKLLSSLPGNVNVLLCRAHLPTRWALRDRIFIFFSFFAGRCRNPGGSHDRALLLSASICSLLLWGVPCRFTVPPRGNFLVKQTPEISRARMSAWAVPSTLPRCCLLESFQASPCSRFFFFSHFGGPVRRGTGVPVPPAAGGPVLDLGPCLSPPPAEGASFSITWFSKVQ